MSLLRSPHFPFWIGCLLALGGILLMSLTQQELLAWILLMLAIPPLVEGEGWRRAASFATLFHDIDSDTVFRDADNPRAALPRYLAINACLLGIIFLRETDRVPDNGWIVVLILAPVLVWIAWALLQYRRDIRRLMRRRAIVSGNVDTPPRIT